jgi:nucleotide-binding universal stress UspA family protein
MLPIRSILYPTDFSESSDYVFHLACALARDYGARLLVLHVTPPPMVVYAGGVVLPLSDRDKEEQWDKLRRLRARNPRVQVEHRLAEGEPAETILRVARETGCDLILMGTHGRTGLGRLLMGSVAEQVVRKAPCPVLTVKTPLPAAASAPGQTAGVPEATGVAT